jgi:hypothetical protein
MSFLGAGVALDIFFFFLAVADFPGVGLCFAAGDFLGEAEAVGSGVSLGCAFGFGVGEVSFFFFCFVVFAFGVGLGDSSEETEAAPRAFRN